MILILSEKNDITTYHVVKWLEYYEKESFVLTFEDTIEILSIESGNAKIKINEYIFNLIDLEAYWYRRGAINWTYYTSIENLPIEISNDLNFEKKLIVELIHNFLLNIPNLSTYYNFNVNRVICFSYANAVGLSTPKFGIYSCKYDVMWFCKKYKKIVTKPIGNGLFVNIENKQYLSYTTLLIESEINKMPDKFSDSLFLEYIEKKYELRIFYLDGTCYSMAILSQNDNKTEVDYRNYNNEKPNRNEPYTLPKKIANKVNILMKKLKLKTGSIDIIVTPNDDFVFLEVNPIGQFLNVSHTCNYNLEKKVAQYLSDITRNK